MKKKATFKGCGYSGKFKIYTWEYHGQTYTTYVNQAQGNAVGDELYKQHQREQERIDESLKFHETYKPKEGELTGADYVMDQCKEIFEEWGI